MNLRMKPVLRLSFTAAVLLLSGCFAAGSSDASREQKRETPLSAPEAPDAKSGKESAVSDAIQSAASSQAEMAAQDKFAEKLGLGMLEAMRDGRYEDFVRGFSPAQRKSMPPEKFVTMRDNIGKAAGRIVEIRYLDRLDQTLFYTYVWKVVFEKEVSEKNGKSPSILRRTLLFAVFIDRATGVPRLFGSRFLN